MNEWCIMSVSHKCGTLGYSIAHLTLPKAWRLNPIELFSYSFFNVKIIPANPLNQNKTVPCVSAVFPLSLSSNYLFEHLAQRQWPYSNPWRWWRDHPLDYEQPKTNTESLERPRCVNELYSSSSRRREDLEVRLATQAGPKLSSQPLKPKAKR